MKTTHQTVAKPVHSSLFDSIKVAVAVVHQGLQEHRTQNPDRIIYTDRQYRVRGRFKGTYAIISSAYHRQTLFIEASIPKFLSGQNLYGSEDLKTWAIKLIDEVLRRARIKPTQEERERYRSGDFELMRVDYANHLWCGDSETATAFMDALRRRSAARAWNFSQYEGNSLYWRQHSSWSTLKAYRKDLEMAKRPLGPDVRDREKVIRNARGLIRFELVLRAAELKRRELNRPDAWTPEIARKLMEEQVAHVLPVPGQVIDLSGSRKLTPVMQDRLELFIRGKVDAFSRHASTFPKARNTVLELTGIDVGLAITPEEQSEHLQPIQDTFRRGWAYKSRTKTLNYLRARKVAAEHTRGPKPKRAMKPQ